MPCDLLRHGSVYLTHLARFAFLGKLKRFLIYCKGRPGVPAQSKKDAAEGEVPAVQTVEDWMLDPAVAGALQ